MHHGTAAVLARPSVLGGSRCRCGRLPAVRQRQPGGELACGLVRRAAVERHHCRGHAGQPAQLRTPSVGDERDLDEKGTPANGFLKAMNHYVCPDVLCVKRVEFYAPTAGDQAKVSAKAASTAMSAGVRARSAQTKFSMSGSPQDLHGSSTGFPHGRRRGREIRQASRQSGFARQPAGRALQFVTPE